MRVLLGLCPVLALAKLFPGVLFSNQASSCHATGFPAPGLWAQLALSCG